MKLNLKELKRTFVVEVTSVMIRYLPVISFLIGFLLSHFILCLHFIIIKFGGFDEIFNKLVF